MATKCIVIDQEVPKLSKIPVVFKKILNTGGLCASMAPPSSFKNIELLAKGYYDGMDLMFAYQEDRNKAIETGIYLGHWNDGIV